MSRGDSRRDSTSAPLRQLTLRGFDKDLRARLRQLAREEGISLNRAALLLLRRAAGIERPAKARPQNAWIDSFAGTMSEREADELLAGLDSCEQVDEEAWR